MACWPDDGLDGVVRMGEVPPDGAGVATFTLVGLELMFGGGVEEIVLMFGHGPIHCADAPPSKKKDGAKMSATQATSNDRLFIVSTNNIRGNQGKVPLYTCTTKEKGPANIRRAIIFRLFFRCCFTKPYRVTT
jgi:hypothetical protein